MDIKLNGGVLIIGSLLWDSKKMRAEWRNKNLKPLDETIKVQVPIRYGRISRSRNCTYSMVFSNECNDSLKLGSAKFLAFLNNPISLDDLWIHCTELIKAEYNDKDKSFSAFNWKWGALGLCTNPKTNSDKLSLLKSVWKTKYNKCMNALDYQVDSEGAIISDEGLLNVKWMQEIDEYDFFIATLTKPEKKYPTPYEIAERMIVNKYVSYFKNNQKYDIITFQDDKIKLELKKIKKLQMKK